MSSHRRSRSRSPRMHDHRRRHHSRSRSRDRNYVSRSDRAANKLEQNKPKEDPHKGLFFNGYRWQKIEEVCTELYHITPHHFTRATHQHLDTQPHTTHMT